MHPGDDTRYYGLSRRETEAQADALANACRRGDSDLVYFLLYHGLADLRYKSRYGKTALEIAADFNRLSCLKLLLLRART